MFIRDLYKYRIDNRTVLSPLKPSEGIAYTKMYRLIAEGDDRLLTDYNNYTKVIDVTEETKELWVEVHKDDLTKPIPQLEQIKENITLIEETQVMQEDMIINTMDALATTYESTLLMEEELSNNTDSILDTMEALALVYEDLLLLREEVLQLRGGEN
jgi:hypothetical protein